MLDDVLLQREKVCNLSVMTVRAPDTVSRALNTDDAYPCETKILPVHIDPSFQNK